MSRLSELREKIRQHTHADEDQCVEALLRTHPLDRNVRDHILHNARMLVKRSRENSQKRGTLDAFLAEFGLSNKEGIALMCLAEALLRVPDAKTADKLIAEKVSIGDWQKHLGQSQSLFVNASTWGLMLTGKIIRSEDFDTDNSWYNNMVSRVGEPIVRQAMLQSMKILGGQYVLGRSIKEAMTRGRKENRPGTRFSFDMLGEGARTQHDADLYLKAYEDAIHAIGKNNKENNVYDADGISVKLSALHPRYQQVKVQRVREELIPRVESLCMLAKEYNIALNIDAEEANRLDLSLSIFKSLAKNTQLENWKGLGFVLQAYQKRAPHVTRWLIELARSTQRTFMVRLVKGAYWDSEIKHAQESGLKDYPVYTRKANTDLSYQVCAKILLEAQDCIFPQFATHNAYTVALIKQLGENHQYEFQRLHGMGDLLFDQLYQETSNMPPVRVYAPVGAHKDLLPYLVRRLLENGANSSFVNRFMDENTPVESLIEDVVDKVEQVQPYRHPKIVLPKNIFKHQSERVNALGIDIDHPHEGRELEKQVHTFAEHLYQGGPIIGGEKLTGEDEVYSPANSAAVGTSRAVNEKEINQAVDLSTSAFPNWNALGGAVRAEILLKASDLLEKNRTELIALITLEAGRTLEDGISEVREAIDFCRYYAELAKKHFGQAIDLPGPTGETNALYLQGRGTFLCISPWNFPLAIFIGQIAAALAAGNCVLAKPAEQTPLIAHLAIKILLEAGVPKEVLHLTTGDGFIGAQILKDTRISGVCFTGSTETAKKIQRQLAENDGPIVPLIAETGGQNAMIVDSTALLEQVVDDVISSSFLSAGQRCSALRVLYIQDDVADNFISMLVGACQELTLGNPWKLETDIGPVIDQKAKDMLVEHINKMNGEAKPIYACPFLSDKGTFVGPHVFEIQSIKQLKREVFGPILHIIRYPASDLDRVIQDINATGYGLTLGIHSRIESQSLAIAEQANVGNAYINRNMVGAVVGVNPFGGQGLSGTGPKAGGPHYLFRFATEKTVTINTVATGGNAQLLSLEQ